MSAKRVLLLVPGAYGEIGGIGLYCRDIAEALVAMPECGEVTIIPRQIQLALEPIPKKARFLTSAATGKRAFAQVALFEAMKGADLVICGHRKLLPLAVAAKMLTRAPLALMVYGLDVWAPSGRLADRLVGRCDAIWSISEVTRDRMSAWTRIPRERFALLPNAIHLDRYGMRPPRSDLRAKHGLDGRKLVMTVGRLEALERFKGIDEMLGCMTSLLASEPSLVYMIVGDGTDRPRLEAKARELGVESNVIFAGYVNESDKADYLRLADAFVMPSRVEGFGFVYIEALACGIPTVGSSIDGSRDALRDGELGELIDPDDPEAIIAATLRALAKPKGIPEGLHYFAWPRFCERLTTAVNNLVR